MRSPANLPLHLDSVSAQGVIHQGRIALCDVEADDTTLGNDVLRSHNEATWPGDAGRDLIAVSAALRDVLSQAERVAASKAAVLIVGETGTGKELLARLIHCASPRARRLFLRINCAALSESLVESELFGHVKGAFTGAEEARIGRFERADGGTLLLDEVSETAVKLQAKLLRVLEEEEFERVGSSQTLRVNVRVIATTNRNLEEEIARGAFRRDLYYRLSVVTLRIPPLRTHREDIPSLAALFFARYRHDTQSVLQGLAPRTLQLLTAYDWPGNVRQLRNAIQHACLLAKGPLIEPCDLPPLEATTPSASGLPGGTLDEIERYVILSTLRELGGNRTATAQRLGVSPRTLLNKLNRYRAEQVSS
jgi:transcriptional regulator with PAS, ATPase and Fis domain